MNTIDGPQMEKDAESIRKSARRPKGVGGVPAARCAATKVDGQPCPLPPVLGLSCCYQHAPEVAEERRAARAKGGYAATRSRVLAGDTPPLSLDSPAAVRQALVDTIQSIRTGQIAPNVGHAVLQGINISLKLAELEVSVKLAELERQVAAERRQA